MPGLVDVDLAAVRGPRAEREFDTIRPERPECAVVHGGFFAWRCGGARDRLRATFEVVGGHARRTPVLTSARAGTISCASPSSRPYRHPAREFGRSVHAVVGVGEPRGERARKRAPGIEAIISASICRPSSSSSQSPTPNDRRLCSASRAACSQRDEFFRAGGAHGSRRRARARAGRATLVRAHGAPSPAGRPGVRSPAAVARAEERANGAVVVEREEVPLARSNRHVTPSPRLSIFHAAADGRVRQRLRHAQVIGLFAAPTRRPCFSKCP